MKALKNYMTWKDMDEFTARDLMTLWNEQNPKQKFSDSSLYVFEAYMYIKMDIRKPNVIESHPIFTNGALNASWS